MYILFVYCYIVLYLYSKKGPIVSTYQFQKMYLIFIFSFRIQNELIKQDN